MFLWKNANEISPKDAQQVLILYISYHNKLDYLVATYRDEYEEFVDRNGEGLCNPDFWCEITPPMSL